MASGMPGLKDGNVPLNYFSEKTIFKMEDIHLEERRRIQRDAAKRIESNTEEEGGRLEVKTVGTDQSIITNNPRKRPIRHSFFIKDILRDDGRNFDNENNNSLHKSHNIKEDLNVYSKHSNDRTEFSTKSMLKRNMMKESENLDVQNSRQRNKGKVNVQ